MAWNTVWVNIGAPSCPSLPASVTLYDSSLVGYKESIGDLGCYNDNYKQGPFSVFHSYG